MGLHPVIYRLLLGLIPVELSGIIPLHPANTHTQANGFADFIKAFQSQKVRSYLKK
jgi:hypothetical protein